MTDKEKLDAVRAEIHRLVDVRGYDRGMANDLFAFIDSLPNEPVSNDLEEAAWTYYDKNKPLIPHELDLHKELISFFIAGAQWQKKRDQSTIELAEDHAYLAGQEKIIAKACEWLENYFKGVSSGTVYLEDFKKAIKE